MPSENDQALLATLELKVCSAVAVIAFSSDVVAACNLQVNDNGRLGAGGFPKYLGKLE